MANKKGSFVAVYALVALAIIVLSTYYFLKPSGPAITDNNIKKFSSYVELEKFVRNNSVFAMGYGRPTLAVSDAMGRAPPPAMAESKAGGVDYSRTNIQVEGVDEADIIKTDGRYIYTVAGGNVVMLDAYPAETAKIVSEINLTVAGEASGIFVNGDRLVVFWQESVEKFVPGPEMAWSKIPFSFMKTHADVYDISDRASPRLANNISIDGSYFNSRMIGDYVYVIAEQPAYCVKGEPIQVPEVSSSSSAKGRVESFPEIYYFDVPDRYYVFTTVASLNIKNDKSEPTSKILLTGAAQNLFVSAGNIYVTYSKYSDAMEIDVMETELLIDKVILPIVPESVRAQIRSIRDNSTLSRWEKNEEIMAVFEKFAGGLSEQERQRLETLVQERTLQLQNELAKEREKTVIQKLSISDGKVEYKTNGEVPGTVLNQFSMDEYNGYFRIATTTSPSFFWGVMTSVQVAVRGITEEEQRELERRTIPSPDRVPPLSTSQNHLYVLDEGLKLAGKLEDLASGERIYSVRFIGDKGYMVTFRQIDPLFVIDLSRPAEPKVLGFLKIPGVSDYLHPYDESHIIGVGRDATEGGRITGMKFSLFDVANVSSPKEISKYIIGERGTESEALRDHRAFLFDRQKSLLVIPVSEYLEGPVIDVPERYWSSYWQGAYVFALDLTDGFVLKGKISHFNETEPVWDATVRRSLYIDDVLYTLSSQKLKANRLSDLSEIKDVALPIAGQPPDYVRVID